MDQNKEKEELIPKKEEKIEKKEISSANFYSNFLYKHDFSLLQIIKRSDYILVLFFHCFSALLLQFYIGTVADQIIFLGKL